MMVTAREIAVTLGATPPSADLDVDGVSAADDPQPGTVSFTTSWTESMAQTVANHSKTLFLVPMDAPASANTVHVERPRLAFALVVRDLLSPPVVAAISPSAIVDPSVQLGVGVSIGHFVVVEAGVVLGDGVRIDHHTVIRNGTVIGDRTRIGSHTSIGGASSAFEFDTDGNPVRIGHSGGVVIGADVEIGSLCSIAQGTINPTRIGDHVKVGDSVIVAHNAQVGRATFLHSGSDINGSVVIGERVWISPKAAVRQKVSIGDDALVGLGAVVVSDVPANMVVAGVPARPRGPRHASAPG
jgi:UDP-3-O-[3-hydroxymyristoyl] glucosamine N-acyltransferase